MYTVHYRKADGQGTKVFMRGLERGMALDFQQKFFDRNPDVTMCWVLDDRGIALNDALWRDPDEAETDRIARAT